MQSREKMICAAMTLAIIAFMVLSPGYIVAHRRNLTQQYRQQSTESYQGIISLWHIVGFKSYQGSMGAWLEKAAATLEKKHKGVYFEVESMTFSDYEARRERGEKADMYSLPLGWEYIEELQPHRWRQCRKCGAIWRIPAGITAACMEYLRRIWICAGCEFMNNTGKGLDMDMLCGILIRSGEAEGVRR